ncbi:hypothetical protein, partial [Sphingobium naphthae]
DDRRVKVHGYGLIKFRKRMTLRHSNILARHIATIDQFERQGIVRHHGGKAPVQLGHGEAAKHREHSSP